MFCKMENKQFLNPDFILPARVLSNINLKEKYLFKKFTRKVLLLSQFPHNTGTNLKQSQIIFPRGKTAIS